jgi:3-oxoadipate enol-lactonase
MTDADGFQFVACNGLTIRCRVDGPSKAPWLLLSNSLLTDLSVWDAQVAAFAGRFRVLRYDQRGHGGTGLSADVVTLDVLVQDAVALLDKFGIHSAAIGGVSMGAATAFGVAVRHPSRVTRVLASDGQAKTAPGGATAWQERIARAEASGMPAVVEATIPRWFRPGFVAEAGPDFQRARAMMHATSLDGYVACATALQAYDFADGLPAIRVPVLLIAGAQDGAMPATMRALQGQIPDARFVEIAEAGHLPNLEQPDAFNAAMQPFLAE